MLDSQYESLVELLEKLNSNVCGVIGLIVFFDYYDKELDNKRKSDDARIKCIIEEYKRNESH